MSNHIRQIIVDALREHGLIAANYSGPVDALAEALTRRAYDVVDAIAERGVELGHDEGEVRRFLDGLGLPSRPNVEVPPDLEAQFNESAVPEGLEARVAILESRVDILTRLAERHLGPIVEPDDVN